MTTDTTSPKTNLPYFRGPYELHITHEVIEDRWEIKTPDEQVICGRYFWEEPDEYTGKLSVTFTLLQAAPCLYESLKGLIDAMGESFMPNPEYAAAHHRALELVATIEEVMEREARIWGLRPG